MTLLFPPSFNSGEPLSARFMYKRAEANGGRSPWVFGTTGYAFIRLAWDALKNFSFEDKSAYATLSLDGRSGPLGLSYAAVLNSWPVIGGDGARTFRVNAPSEEGAQGISWDNDFNRALWSWTRQQWTASRRARGLQDQRAEFQRVLGGGLAASAILLPLFPVLAAGGIAYVRSKMNEPESRTWWGILDAIEQCELEQRVNPVALQMACLLVAVRLQLVARSDASVVSLISADTIPLPYRRSPVRPSDPTGEIASRRFRTWPYRNDGGDPLAGMAVSDDPARPTPSVPAQQGTPVPPGQAEEPSPVLAPFPSNAAPSPVVGLGAGETVAINAGYVLGGAMVVGGAIHALLNNVRRDQAAEQIVENRGYVPTQPMLPSQTPSQTPSQASPPQAERSTGEDR